MSNEQQKSENKDEANELLTDMLEGVSLLMAEHKVDDEKFKEHLNSWVKERLAELALIIIQQKNAVEEMAKTMDEVFTKLRRWSEGSKSGWKTAKSILEDVLRSWRKRHGGDGEEESTDGATAQEIIDSASPSLKTEL